MIVAPDDVRDGHGHVVDDHAEVVGGRSVGADEDPVVELPVLERDGPVDEIVHHGRALVRDAQAQRAGGEAAVTTAAGVAERLLARLGRLALGVQRLGRAVAVVRAAALQQALRMRAIDVEALGLPVARRRRPLVPVEPEPPQGVDDEVDVLVGRARLVGVLDPQDEHATVMPREQPVEQRRPRPADVQMPGRTRREPHAYGGRRGISGIWTMRSGRRRRHRHGISLYRATFGTLRSVEPFPIEERQHAVRPPAPPRTGGVGGSGATPPDVESILRTSAS